MDDLIQEFLIESTENLDRLDSELVKLESDPTERRNFRELVQTLLKNTSHGDPKGI